MHHSMTMSFVQRIRNLNAVLESLIEGQQSFLQPVRQSLTLDVLHDQVVSAVLLADIVEGARVSYGLHIREAYKGNASG
jgi:hypothetical protein